jgi:four helix bundle protein
VDGNKMVNGKISDFKEMRVWQMSMKLAESIYRLSNDFPKSEMYGLTSQLRRCAVSIPSNIAEGFSRKSTNEFIQFLYISLGSCSECETQLIIAKRVGYLESEREIVISLISIRKMIYALIASLDKRKTNGK